MWPSVAAGVLMLAALSTWASGVFRQKAPEAMIEQKGQTTQAPTVKGPRQSKAELPVVASPAKSKSPAAKQETDPRAADARPAGELASVGTGTKETTELDGRPGPLTPPEGSPNISGNRPEMPPPRKVEEVASTALRGPSARPALLPSNGPVHQDSGSWRMTAPPVQFVLVAEGNERAPGSFWPELSAGNSQAWLVGDPHAIKLTGKGLSLEKGSAGNVLLTRKSDYRKCSMSITLAALENAEAYLALRAPGTGWMARGHLTHRLRGWKGSCGIRLLRLPDEGTRSPDCGEAYGKDLPDSFRDR